MDGNRIKFEIYHGAESYDKYSELPIIVMAKSLEKYE